MYMCTSAMGLNGAMQLAGCCILHIALLCSFHDVFTIKICNPSVIVLQSDMFVAWFFGKYLSLQGWQDLLFLRLKLHAWPLKQYASMYTPFNFVCMQHTYNEWHILCSQPLGFGTPLTSLVAPFQEWLPCLNQLCSKTVFQPCTDTEWGSQSANCPAAETWSMFLQMGSPWVISEILALLWSAMYAYIMQYQSNILSVLCLETFIYMIKCLWAKAHYYYSDTKVQWKTPCIDLDKANHGDRDHALQTGPTVWRWM